MPSFERQEVISFRLQRIVFNQTTDRKLPPGIQRVIVFRVQIEQYRIATRVVPSDCNVLER